MKDLDSPDQVAVYENPKRISVDLWYPPRKPGEIPERIAIIEVGLCDVRAADNIRISYDFDRDGYAISQCEGVDHGNWIETPDPEVWREVAFIPAWGLVREP